MHFEKLNAHEKAAIAAYARDQWERTASLEPSSYVSRNANADPSGWQQRFCELIAADPKLVQEIIDISQRGFTLVELSIVLIVIGLIVGCVLVGQDLLRTAQIRKMVNEVEQYRTAVYTFRVKYACLPGDCANATTFFGTDSNGCPAGGGATGTCNGDGNGQIDDSACDYGCYENYRFFQQLADANLIPENFDGIPGPGGPWDTVAGVNVPLSGAFGGNATYWIYYLGGFAGNGNYFPSDYEHTLQLFAANNLGNSGVPFLSGVQAQSVDAKYDDGLIASGRIMGPNQSLNPNCPTTNVASTAQYNIAYGGPACAEIFKLGF